MTSPAPFDVASAQVLVTELALTLLRRCTPDGDPSHTLIVFRRDGRVMTYALSELPQANKHGVAALFAALAQASDAVAVASIMPAWAAKRTDNDAIPPSRAKDRIEVIQLYLEPRDGEITDAVGDVRRHAGAPPTLHGYEWKPNPNAGTFTHLFLREVPASLLDDARAMANDAHHDRPSKPH